MARLFLRNMDDDNTVMFGQCPHCHETDNLVLEDKANILIRCQKCHGTFSYPPSDFRLVNSDKEAIIINRRRN